MSRDIYSINSESYLRVEEWHWSIRATLQLQLMEVDIPTRSKEAWKKPVSVTPSRRWHLRFADIQRGFDLESSANCLSARIPRLPRTKSTSRATSKPTLHMQWNHYCNLHLESAELPLNVRLFYEAFRRSMYTDSSSYESHKKSVKIIPNCLVCDPHLWRRHSLELESTVALRFIGSSG